MANPNVFMSMLQPVKSVQEYDDERAAREVNRMALQDKRRASQVADQTFQQQTSDRNALQRAAMESGGDQNKLIQLLRASGSAGLMTQADGLEKSMLERRNTESQIGERAAKTGSEQAKSAVEKLSLIGQLAGGVRDQATYEAALNFLGASGFDMAKLGAPAHYDPAVIERFRTQAMTEKDRAEQEFKRLQQQEVGRHNVATEQGTIRGQDVTAATTRRGQNMTDARARDATAATREASAAALSKPFEVTGQDGAPTLVQQTRDGKIIPVQGFSPKGATSGKVSEAKEALELLDQAELLIKGATGSTLGAALDGAAQFFGSATQGSIKAQQLKAIEGALVAKMPKMSGPQSDKDVLLYRQMAAEIGDPTVPYERKAAAMGTVREIQERYAGMAPGGSKPTASPNSGGATRITDDAGYNALPSGATFIGPDGKTRRKP